MVQSKEYDNQYVNKFCSGNSKLADFYVIHRNDILKKLPFNKDDFNSFDLLQESIRKLNFNADAVFELIAFLYNQIEFTANFSNKSNELITNFNNTVYAKYPSTKMFLKQMGKLFFPEEKVKQLISETVNDPLLTNMLLFNSIITNRYKEYLMVKNLEIGLPPINRKPNIKYTNYERAFYLRVWHFCKYLKGDPNVVCYVPDNSATFNQLIRDFDTKDFSLFENIF